MGLTDDGSYCRDLLAEERSAMASLYIPIFIFPRILSRCGWLAILLAVKHTKLLEQSCFASIHMNVAHSYWPVIFTVS